MRKNIIKIFTPTLALLLGILALNHAIASEEDTALTLRDPTIPKPKKQSYEPAYKSENDRNAQEKNTAITLMGIINNGIDKVAIINNQIYHIGDKVLDRNILEIKDNFVKLQWKDEIITIYLPKYQGITVTDAP